MVYSTQITMLWLTSTLENIITWQIDQIIEISLIIELLAHFISIQLKIMSVEQFIKKRHMIKRLLR